MHASEEKDVEKIFKLNPVQYTENHLSLSDNTDVLGRGYAPACDNSCVELIAYIQKGNKLAVIYFWAQKNCAEKVRKSRRKHIVTKVR